jgi:2'-5' RNA ligase
MKFKDMFKMLNEAHEYSCAMLKFKEDDIVAKIMSALQKIPKEVLQDEGLEYEPHVTLLYGIHTDDPNVIVKSVPITGPIKIKVLDVSLFENDDFDVVKLDLESDELVKANRCLKKLDHTSSYPDYKPHCTLAYVAPGKGGDVIKTIRDDMEDLIGNELEAEYVYISTPSGPFEKYMKKL